MILGQNVAAKRLVKTEVIGPFSIIAYFVAESKATDHGRTKNNYDGTEHVDPFEEDGWSNRKIAKTLHLDRKTVDSYVKRLAEHNLDTNTSQDSGKLELQELFVQEPG